VLIVRTWFVGALLVIALTGFALIPPDSSLLQGTSVAETRSALDNALAAAIAGAAYSLLSLAIVTTAIAKGRRDGDPDAVPRAAVTD